MNSQSLFFNNAPPPSIDDRTETLSLRSDDAADLQAFLSDDDEEHAQFHRHRDLPPHACSYCGIHNPTCVVRCDSCNKWFCNSKSTGGRSHIVTHLILSRHHTVSLHEQSDLGDTALECYNCGSKNVFLLGFVSAKQEAVVVILCRLPCAQAKDSTWDTGEWESLIEDKAFLPWVAAIPGEEEEMNATPVTAQQIAKLESKWRVNKDATLDDVEEKLEEEEVLPILMRYNDAYQYQRSFGPLVKLEADCDKAMKESQALEHISVKWGLGLNNRHLASFGFSTYESGGLKIAVGDEMVLRYNGLNSVPWEGRGYIVRLPNAHQEEFTMELMPSKKDGDPPTHQGTGFTAEFVWKGTSYDRMQDALKDFAVDEESVSGHIYHKLLGHDVPDVEFDVKLPSSFDIPGMTSLNSSQTNAVKRVLQRPLSLIQGPPGTGKTVTSATIIYHLSKLNKEKVLVCAPSNVAVDHLAQKLSLLKLKVLRLTARSREDVDSNVAHLALHSMVKRNAKGELKKLIRLKEELGELSVADMNRYNKLIKRAEAKELASADIVCATCVGAGDRRLQGMNFKSVLIDESTQASEPECLIPIVKGVKQVILVGDHQQLGPVILDMKAGEAGLKQSLFERMVILGHIPIRLEVQYRMNPYLSEFPSNMFYEGSLQNGVTTAQRRIPNSMFPWPILDIPMMFWSNYGREEISASGTSFLNRIEAMNCERIVSTLFKDGVKPEQIGIVTPYEGQRTYVVQYMQLNGSLADKSLYMDVEVASVDAFQGREKDFIIFSCVRSNDKQLIGFLSDPRRLNVAITRAKYGLVILGNPRVLCKNALWNHLAIHFREKGCLVEGSLENLQLCTLQLRSADFNGFNPRSHVAMSARNSVRGGGDDDTESMASFASSRAAAPHQRGGGGAGFRGQFSTQDGNGLPPFFNTKQWPSLQSEFGDDSDNGDTDSDTATINNNNNNANNENDEEYYSRGNAIDSSFSTKLQQLNAANGKKNIEDDIKSLASSFAGQLGLR